MFDFHIHTNVSCDSKETWQNVIRMAQEKGLREICFTDHRDYYPGVDEPSMRFDLQAYSAAYDNIPPAPGLKIRRGMEFGMLPDNREAARQDARARHYDFILGSVHFAEGGDIYYPPFWEGKTIDQAERAYLLETLACVREHEDFDVLAHLTYASKAWSNPVKRPIRYALHRDVADEILKILVAKGKGLEMNTSGVDRCGDFLPDADYFRRFRELGGEIVTVGSDAHAADRVGQHTHRACEVLKEIFGYVCTFEDRKPIFHKL